MSSAPGQLHCPRCGYDVSGIVPTWTESCPLDGMCSECGLGFAWVDIFRPERVHPKWSFEHAKKRRMRALASTLWRTLAPRLLWKQLRLAAPIRGNRLAVLALLAVLSAHLVAFGGACQAHWSELWVRTFTATGNAATLDWDEINILLAWPYGEHWDRLVGPLALMFIVWGVLAPLPYLVLEQTMAAARIRRAHLMRAWVYFLVPLSAAAIVAMMMNILPQLWFRQTGVYLLASTPRRVWNMAGLVLFILGATWMTRWWLVFTGEYLQLPTPRKVAFTLMVISLLAALAICLGIDLQMRYAVGGLLDSMIGN